MNTTDDNDSEPGHTPNRYPVMTGVMLGCTALGALLGVWLLTEQWTVWRRLTAGGVGGVGVGFLIIATNLVRAMFDD